jgi:hypothetical protein
MKSIIALLMLICTPSYAFTLSGTIDYSNLYDGTNAGRYSISYEFKPFKDPVEPVTRQEHSMDDGIRMCSTTINYSLGTSTVTITDENGVATSESNPIGVALSESVEGDACPSEESVRASIKNLTIVMGSVNYKLPVLPLNGDAYFTSSISGPRLNIDLKGQRLAQQIDATALLATAFSQNQTLSGSTYLESVDAENSSRLSWGNSVFSLYKE